MLLSLILALFVCLTPRLEADDSFKSTVSGTIFCASGVTEWTMPVENANILLISGKDTLYTTSDKKGWYEFSIDKSFEVEMQVSCLGYKTYRDTYQLGKEHTVIAVKLEPQTEVLEEASVKADIPFMRSREDTVFINAAALDRMEGDRAIELIKQIPGFELANGRLKVWGEDVAKTYVNGKLVYGDDPMSAIKLLGAEEVKSINVYDQQTALDKHRGLKNSKKERVLDLRTFSSFLSAVDMTVQARGGADEAKDPSSGNLQPRYAAGTDFAYNSEMTQFNTKLNINNICDDSNALEVIGGTAPVLNQDRQHICADVDFTKKWKDAEWGDSFTANYNFSRDRSAESSKRIIDRYKSEGNIEDLHYEESRTNDILQGSHSFYVGADLKQTAVKDVCFSIGATSNNGSQYFKEDMSNHSKNTGTFTQNQTREECSSGRGIYTNLEWKDTDLKNGWMPGLKISADSDRKSNSSIILDTLSSSFSRRYLVGDANGGSKSVTGSVFVDKVLADNVLYTSNLEALVQVDYKNTSLNKMTVDRLASSRGIADSLDISNSCRYSWNDLSIVPAVKFNCNIGGLHSFSIMTGLNMLTQKDNETFPAVIKCDKHYLMPANSNISLIFNINKNKVYFLYNLTGQVPSIEQTRKRLTNYNPLRLQLGNPDLKPMYNHQLSFNFFSKPFKDGSAIVSHASLSFLQDAIVDKLSYYSSAESIHIWGQDYTIPAGASLTSYENASGSMNLYIDARYDRRIKAIRSTLSSTISYSFKRTPQYDGAVLNHVSGIDPSLVLALTSMPFGKVLRLGVSSKSTYVREKNNSDILLADAFVESLSASVELHFLKHAFCDTRYSCSLFKYFGGTGINTDIHNLNFALGYRFLDGDLGVSISGQDLLNQAMRYQHTATSSEYIQSWVPSYGRYFMLNVAYRLGSRK